MEGAPARPLQRVNIVGVASFPQDQPDPPAVAHAVRGGPARSCLGGAMPDLMTEREHLLQADRDIADGERRITAQTLLVERLRTAGHDTREAERLLLNLRQTLETWRDHRDAILHEIARLERIS